MAQAMFTIILVVIITFSLTVPALAFQEEVDWMWKDLKPSRSLAGQCHNTQARAILVRNAPAVLEYLLNTYGPEVD